MKIENLKRKFEKELQELAGKYAWKFIKQGYLVSWTLSYIPLKNKPLYKKVKNRPAIKLSIGKK